MDKPNLNGWEKLICPFFEPACRRTLSLYLEENGFSEKSLNEIGGLVFSRFKVFMEISYELETAPNYALSLVIGIGERKYDEGGHSCCVPSWYLLPRDRPDYRGEMTRFRNEAELESLLLRFKAGFLELYAKPLWSNEEDLKSMIAHFRAEFNC